MTEIYLKTFEIDSDGDLVIDDMKRIPMITGHDKIKQDVKILLETFKGDDTFHLDFGFDYKQVADSDDDKILLAQLLQAAIFKYQFAKSVDIDNIVDVPQGDGSYQRYVDVTVLLFTEEELQLTVSV